MRLRKLKIFFSKFSKSSLLKALFSDSIGVLCFTLLKFLEGLKNDRKKGYCFTEGQVDKGLIGFAVSISNKKLGIVASLSSIFNLDDFLLEHEPIIYANLTTYGLLVEKYINEIFDDIQKYHHETNSIR